jgi:SAM-dependent methyltransferase
MSSNPFTELAIVAGYEAWYQTTGRRADRLEKALLDRLLASFSGASTVLDVGCGTGHFTRWFSERGLRAVGLDVSRPMLVEANRVGSPPCVCGDGLALPFPTHAFDLVALITTLEFVPDPAQALTEALRLAKRGLILGILNGQSWLGRQLRLEGGPIWEVARFFTPSELADLVKFAAGGRPLKVAWRTTLWPLWPGSLPLPWGGFIGMAVVLS